MKNHPSPHRTASPPPPCHSFAPKGMFAAASQESSQPATVVRRRRPRAAVGGDDDEEEAEVEAKRDRKTSEWRKTKSYGKHELMLGDLAPYMDGPVAEFTQYMDGQKVYRLAANEDADGTPLGCLIVSVEDMTNALKVSTGKAGITMVLQSVDIEEIEGYGSRRARVMDLSVISSTIGQTAMSLAIVNVCLVLNPDQLHRQSGFKASDRFIFREELSSSTVRLLVRQLSAAAARSVVVMSFADEKINVQFMSTHDPLPGGMISLNRTADLEGKASEGKASEGDEDEEEDCTQDAIQEIMTAVKNEKEGVVPEQCPEMRDGTICLLPATSIATGTSMIKALLDRMSSFQAPHVDLQVYATSREDTAMLLFSAENEEMGTVKAPLLFRYGDRNLAFHRSLDEDEVAELTSRSHRSAPNFSIRINRDMVYDTLKGMCTIGSRMILFRFLSSSLKTDMVSEMRGDERKEADMLFIHADSTVRGERGGYLRFSSSVVLAGMASSDDS